MNQQTWNPERYARNARFVADLAMPVVDLLAPQSGETVLDLGCGDGALTVKLKELGCTVRGVDASPEQIEAARKLGLDAEVLSGEELDFDNEFDAVFSNAALHWMKNPDKVITGVWRALKPGGRFVAECGGAGNIAAIIQALETALARRNLDVATLNPWYFASPEEYREKLERRGFTVESIELIPRPTPLPGDVTGWLETFAESFTSAVPATERPALLAELRALLEPRLCDRAGQWTADYVRLRFAARKPLT